MSNRFSRRGFLQSAAAAAGFLGASRLLPGLGRRAVAAAATDAPALFVLYLKGGYNALFCSADSFVSRNSFGVSASNITRIGSSDLYVDQGSLGGLSAATLGQMASIGVKHGQSSHPGAQNALWMDGGKSYPLELAVALGGTAAIRAVAIGNSLPPGDHRAIGDVSLQQVRDLATSIAALGGVTRGVAPTRGLAAAGLAGAEAMSTAQLGASPTTGSTLTEGYPAAVALLEQEAQTFDYNGMAAAYGVPAATDGSYPTAVKDVRMQMVGAELMIRAGANVVVATMGGWDSHGDRDGSSVRAKMRQSGINGALKAFTDRTLALSGRNVVTAIIGDFSRSLPGSNHQANLTATVIGKHVKLGTTGRVDRAVGLPAGTPGVQGLWAYLAAVLQAPSSPFGSNPHGLVR